MPSTRESVTYIHKIDCRLCRTRKRYKSNDCCVECQRQARARYSQRHQEDLVFRTIIPANAKELIASADYSDKPYQGIHQ